MDFRLIAPDEPIPFALEGFLEDRDHDGRPIPDDVELYVVELESGGSLFEFRGEPLVYVFLVPGPTTTYVVTSDDRPGPTPEAESFLSWANSRVVSMVARGNRLPLVGGE